MKLWRIYTLFALSTSAILFSSGCASTGGSIGAGAGTGALLGAGVGAIADPGKGGENRLRNVIIGTAAGGVLGAGTGFILDRHVKDERQASFDRGKEAAAKENEGRSAGSGAAPELIPARTEARWVKDSARGGTFVPGHFEYVIIEGAHWSTEKK